MECQRDSNPGGARPSDPGRRPGGVVTAHGRLQLFRGWRPSLTKVGETFLVAQSLFVAVAEQRTALTEIEENLSSKCFAISLSSTFASAPSGQRPAPCGPAFFVEPATGAVRTRSATRRREAGLALPSTIQAPVARKSLVSEPQGTSVS